MKPILFLSIAFAFYAQKTLAVSCDYARLTQKAYQAAYVLEKINGGGAFLTKEMHSLSSQYNTFVIVYSYSGIQRFWKVKVDTQACLVKSVSLEP